MCRELPVHWILRGRVLTDQDCELNFEVSNGYDRPPETMACLPESADLFGCALTFHGSHEAFVNVRGNGVLFHSLEDLDGLLGGIADHPAIGAFGNMPLEFSSKLGVCLFVEVVG